MVISDYCLGCIFLVLSTPSSEFAVLYDSARGLKLHIVPLPLMFQ